MVFSISKGIYINLKLKIFAYILRLFKDKDKSIKINHEWVKFL